MINRKLTFQIHTRDLMPNPKSMDRYDMPRMAFSDSEHEGIRLFAYNDKTKDFTDILRLVVPKSCVKIDSTDPRHRHATVSISSNSSDELQLVHCNMENSDQPINMKTVSAKEFVQTWFNNRYKYNADELSRINGFTGIADISLGEAHSDRYNDTMKGVLNDWIQRSPNKNDKSVYLLIPTVRGDSSTGYSCVDITKNAVITDHMSKNGVDHNCSDIKLDMDKMYNVSVVGADDTAKHFQMRGLEVLSAYMTGMNQMCYGGHVGCKFYDGLESRNEAAHIHIYNSENYGLGSRSYTDQFEQTGTDVKPPVHENKPVETVKQQYRHINRHTPFVKQSGPAAKSVKTVTKRVPENSNGSSMDKLIHNNVNHTDASVSRSNQSAETAVPQTSVKLSVEPVKQPVHTSQIAAPVFRSFMAYDKITKTFAGANELLSLPSYMKDETGIHTVDENEMRHKIVPAVPAGENRGIVSFLVQPKNDVTNKQLSVVTIPETIFSKEPGSIDDTTLYRIEVSPDVKVRIQDGRKNTSRLISTSEFFDQYKTCNASMLEASVGSSKDETFPEISADGSVVMKNFPENMLVPSSKNDGIIWASVPLRDDFTKNGLAMIPITSRMIERRPGLGQSGFVDIRFSNVMSDCTVAVNDSNRIVSRQMKVESIITNYNKESADLLQSYVIKSEPTVKKESPAKIKTDEIEKHDAEPFDTKPRFKESVFEKMTKISDESVSRSNSSKVQINASGKNVVFSNIPVNSCVYDSVENTVMIPMSTKKRGVDIEWFIVDPKLVQFSDNDKMMSVTLPEFSEQNDRPVKYTLKTTQHNEKKGRMGDRVTVSYSTLSDILKDYNFAIDASTLYRVAPSNYAATHQTGHGEIREARLENLDRSCISYASEEDRSYMHPAPKDSDIVYKIRVPVDTDDFVDILYNQTEYITSSRYKDGKPFSNGLIAFNEVNPSDDLDVLARTSGDEYANVQYTVGLGPVSDSNGKSTDENPLTLNVITYNKNPDTGKSEAMHRNMSVGELHMKYAVRMKTICNSFAVSNGIDETVSMAKIDARKAVTDSKTDVVVDIRKKQGSAKPMSRGEMTLMRFADIMMSDDETDKQME